MIIIIFFPKKDFFFFPKKENSLTLQSQHEQTKDKATTGMAGTGKVIAVTLWLLSQRLGSLQIICMAKFPCYTLTFSLSILALVFLIWTFLECKHFQTAVQNLELKISNNNVEHQTELQRRIANDKSTTKESLEQIRFQMIHHRSLSNTSNKPYSNTHTPNNSNPDPN